MSRLEVEGTSAPGRTNALGGPPGEATGGHYPRRVALARLTSFVRSYPVLTSMAATVLGLEVLVPRLLTGPELMSVLNQIAPLALIAMGLSVALSASALDISVAQIADMAAVSSGLLLAGGASVWETIALTLLVGLAIGAVNGIIASWVGISSLITTLAMTFALEGIELILTHGGAATTLFSLTNPAASQFTQLGQGTIGPVSVSLLVVAGVGAVLFFIEQYSVLGREVRLVGQNLSAATAIGIRVRRRFAAAFVMSGALGAVAGLMVLSMTGIATPGSGSGYLVEAFAAAYIGGLVGRQPRFSVVAAFVGAVYVSVLAAGLTLMGAGAATQDLVEGAVLVLAIGLNRLRSHN